MALTLTALAQTNAVVLPPLPQTVTQYWDLVIAIITPLIVTGIWKYVPKIPKMLLPLMTPLLGIGLGLLLNWLAKANLGWVDMAKAGALAVFIREAFNQAVTKPAEARAAVLLVNPPAIPK